MNKTIKILIAAGIFWILDFIMHVAGAGETNYYYTIKMANAILFAFIWFSVYNKKEHWKKFVFSIVFGIWVSFFYLISSYSGAVQFFGIYARYTPPVFMIFGKILPPYLWWFYHILSFYAGLEISSSIFKKENKKGKRK